jgi:hypothetical protein
LGDHVYNINIIIGCHRENANTTPHRNT